MIVVPISNSVGWVSPFYLNVIREPTDIPGSYPFTVCIKDSSGSVVLSKSFTYDFTRDVETFAVDVSSLSEGVYKVYIYNWTDCNPPSNVPTFVYWLHYISGGTYLSLDGWDYRRTYMFMLYVYDGKLFWQYWINTSDVVIPSGVPVYLEVTDGSGNAFVGSVTGSGGTVYLRPNMKIPFIAIFRIRYEDKVVPDILRAFSGFVWMMKNSYVDMVDDYTIEIGVVKTEPGFPVFAVIAIGLILLGAFGIWAWHDSNVKNAEVESKRLDYAKVLIDRISNAYDKMSQLVNLCNPNDMNCIMKAVQTWYPVVQTLSSNIQLLQSMGITPTACNGLNLGGVCVPWWVVAVAIFLAGLLVIAAIK